ncbi:Asp23/Gls24 family envelope stress response protein [Streptomyces geranii]|uniref:Asp23/Gls24 family envelope stress response protein n=1 Tax=Streptomyces geranii TaxID=2058923 RepID=UPI000D031218|nr:Asp23/Gls24 family envelope stress response protein [Streptomyces geranii]
MTDRTDPPNDTSAHGDDELLPCGRPLSQVWDDWERHPDDTHLHACPHCRDAVRGLDQLETAVRDLRNEEADSALDTTTLTRRVMDLVRLELRPGRPLPLGGPAEDLWVMEAVAARVLRAAVESVTGVRAGSCRLRDLRADETADGAMDQGVAVCLDIHAPAGVSIPYLAEQVRERLLEAADRELGMAIAAVDIRVTDLVPTPADGQEGGAR